MYCYKHMESGKIISFETSENKNDSEGYIEISVDEYQNEINKLSSSENNDNSDIDTDEYIEQLEAENAALLYQILTGEEL